MQTCCQLLLLLPLARALVVPPHLQARHAAHSGLALSSGVISPGAVSKASLLRVSMHGGKGFGGGEATRDPAPTEIDPSDPKGKQQAIHKAESFAEYLAKRGGYHR